MNLTVEPLNESTWPDFARLVERHNGVWGGCWCIAFHDKWGKRHRPNMPNRDWKECAVREGRAHAALVYDGPDAVAWCQFGSTPELPSIKHQREYDAGVTQLPDWRITCFFVDRQRRRKGLASVALEGALSEIAGLGGGVVEAYPEDVEGRKTSGSFLHGGTVAMFERLGFERTRRLGMHHWVVTKNVQPIG